MATAEQKETLTQSNIRRYESERPMEEMIIQRSKSPFAIISEVSALAAVEWSTHVSCDKLKKVSRQSHEGHVVSKNSESSFKNLGRPASIAQQNKSQLMN